MKQSMFAPYALGEVAQNLKAGTDVIEVWPKEYLPSLEGEVKSDVVEVATKGIMLNNKPYTSKIKIGNTISAKWLPSSSNRITPPNVRRKERVLLYRLGTTNQYYWRTLGLDQNLRRLETLIYVFSANPKNDNQAKIDFNNSYFFELSTHEKLVTFGTTNLNGEKAKYNIQLNTGDGTFLLEDDQGNYVYLDSVNTLFEHVNNYGSKLQVDKGKIYLGAKEEIFLDTAVLKIKAEEAVKVDTKIQSIKASDGYKVQTKAMALEAPQFGVKSPAIHLGGNVGILGVATAGGAMLPGVPPGPTYPSVGEGGSGSASKSGDSSKSDVPQLKTPGATGDVTVVTADVATPSQKQAIADKQGSNNYITGNNKVDITGVPIAPSSYGSDYSEMKINEVSDIKLSTTAIEPVDTITTNNPFGDLTIGRNEEGGYIFRSTPDPLKDYEPTPAYHDVSGNPLVPDETYVPGPLGAPRASYNKTEGGLNKKYTRGGSKVFVTRPPGGNSGWEPPMTGKRTAAPFIALIRSMEEKYKMPYNLLARLFSQESAYDPKHIYDNKGNYAGAMGIGQIVYKVHKVELMKTNTRPWVPEEAIPYCAKYLAQLRRTLGYNWSYALAAYNWGIGNVMATFDRPGDWPIETKNYVTEIMHDTNIGEYNPIDNPPAYNPWTYRVGTYGNGSKKYYGHKRIRPVPSMKVKW